jgi:DNA-binding transcriptional ArsR family regulator
MQDSSVTRFATMLAALSQPTRLRIIGVVAAGGDGGTPAGQIARAVNCPPSTLSFHLKELTQAGLLAADPQGRFIRYSVVPAALLSLSDFVRALPGTGPDTTAAPAAGTRKPRKAAKKVPKLQEGKEEGQLSIFEE